MISHDSLPSQHRTTSPRRLSSAHIVLSFVRRQVHSTLNWCNFLYPHHSGLSTGTCRRCDIYRFFSLKSKAELKDRAETTQKVAVEYFFVDTLLVDRIYISLSLRTKARPPRAPPCHVGFSMTTALTVGSAFPFNAALHANFTMPSATQSRKSR